MRGKFFIDGGLHQGLLGLADYANLAFIQENNVWFIRFLQIINVCTLVVINRPGYYNAFKKSFFFKNYSKFMKKNLNKHKIIPQKTWIYISDKGKKISSSNIKNRLYKNN